MADGERRVLGVRFGLVRLSLVAWVMVLLFGGAGVTYLAVTGGTENVCAAVRDLPPYHQMTAEDLRIIAVPRGSAPEGAVGAPAVLVGRYTLRTQPAGQPLALDAMGPVLPSGSLGRPVVALAAAPETTMGNRLQRGDRVDVLLPSPDDAVRAALQPVRVTGALVLDLVTEPSAAVVLQVSASEVPLVAGLRGVPPVVVRTAPYRSP